MKYVNSKSVAPVTGLLFAMLGIVTLPAPMKKATRPVGSEMAKQ